ncbi:hypothetical protein [Robertmurraya sp. FSL R5-0851]|uniref:hypothetical protein n=1 Tax=Robertmurraya sp. FSL R5-0851 TaxID=2921584 RepID=UPI0030F94754
MKKVKMIICLAIICLSVPLAAQAGTVLNGALTFNGGQSDTKVYSEILDHKNELYENDDDGVNYAVSASVKVGGTTYSSGWKYGYAFKSQNRVWYANETAHYNAQVIRNAYTYSNWGTSY